MIPFSRTLIGGWKIKQPGFFDIEERLARLGGLGDQLEAFPRTVDFKVFLPDWNLALAYSDENKGGRPPFDPVLMFNILIIQTLNNLSDERREYLINDRLSFIRFLGLGLSDRIPNAKTIWLFRERPTQAGAIERLFDRFDATLCDAGFLPMSGQILDATLVAAPKQRNPYLDRAMIEGQNKWTLWINRGVREYTDFRSWVRGDAEITKRAR